MMHKRSKVRRQRGGRTYGWGKHHRGSGNRGGAGHSATGKKAQAKKPLVWKDHPFGAYGFHQRVSILGKVITLRSLEERIFSQELRDRKKGSGDLSIDLSKEGFSKLLGTGRVTRKLHVTVPRATASAIRKIEAVGGSCTVSERVEE